MQDFLFDEATIQERFKDFFDIADKFCDEYNEGQDVKVEIDSSLLYLAVVAIYDDVARYKAYHLPNPIKQKANPIKRAAYAVKWLMHFSPLIFPQMGHATGRHAPEDADTLANAMFALHFAMMNLRVHTGTNFSLKQEMHFELIYDLLYRGLTTDSLILLFDVVSALAITGDVSSVIE
jgi:hypothetical protein